MKQVDIRIWIGAGLILLGGLMLLERIGLLQGAVGLLWALVLVAGGAYFVYRFVSSPRGQWWAVIPGFALLGSGLAALLPGRFGDWSGLIVLGGLGLSFVVIYISERQRWWALIPAGVLLTLAITSVMNRLFSAAQTGGIFFLGLGITFLLVALLASLEWAYIPGVVLLLMGVLLGSPFSSALNLLWPAALILAGLFLIFQFARRR